MFHVPPRRILVPIDGTEQSMAGWRQALTLSKLMGSRLEAVYVRPWEAGSGELGMAEAAFCERAHREARNWIRARIGGGPLHRFDGDPVQRISRFAERQGFDLICMATHGREGLARAFYGSVAEDLARVSRVPVLAVKKPRDYFRSVLAPVNLTDYSRAGLEAAASAATALCAELTVVSVMQPPSPPEEVLGLRNLLESEIARLPEYWRDKTAPRVKIAFGEAVQEIVRESRKHDLVVVVSHVKHPVRDRLLGTTAERALRSSEAPVLVVPSATPHPAGAV